MAVGSSAISIGHGEAVTKPSASSTRSRSVGAQAETSNIKAASHARRWTILGHKRLHGQPMESSRLSVEIGKC